MKLIFQSEWSRSVRATNGPLTPALSPSDGEREGFTLLEMLVVLAIIGMLAAVSLPFLKGINRSNTMAVATRQLLDDIELARHRAIAGHTTVYMVFMPPADYRQEALFAGLSGPQRTNMLTGQLTSYALLTRRGIGEQPGSPDNPRYLTKWHSLPEGVFIPIEKFAQSLTNPIDGAVIRRFSYTNNIPIPTVDGGVINIDVPYIAFDYLGQLTEQSNLIPGNGDNGETIPLARGSIFYPRDANGALAWDYADARENPPGNSINNFNRIYIDWLTGRASIEQLKIAGDATNSWRR